MTQTLMPARAAAFMASARAVVENEKRRLQIHVVARQRHQHDVRLEDGIPARIRPGTDNLDRELARTSTGAGK